MNASFRRLSPDAREYIFYSLAEANGRRRVRVLSEESVSSLINNFDPSKTQYDWHCGGSVTNSYGHRASTTIAMVAEIGGEIYLAIGTCDANKPSPGRAWPCLQPFGSGSEETIAKKLREWSWRHAERTTNEDPQWHQS